MPPFQTPRIQTQIGRGFQAYLPPAHPSTWLTLGVGALLGLLVGLLLGWQVFPVQWTDAWPGDLSREARAQYLAAVAEAYAYYGDDEAAEIARNRLFDLSTDLEASIADAIDFFAATRPRNFNATITHLGLLAQRLGVAAPMPAADAAPGVGDSVRAWVNWTLTALAAVLLAAGGIYIVNLMQKRRLNQDGFDDDSGGFDDEETVRAPRVAPARNPFMRPAQATALRPSATGASHALEPNAGDDYGFEDEGDDDYPAQTQVRARPIATADDYALRDEAFDDDVAYDDYPDDEFDDEEADNPFADTSTRPAGRDEPATLRGGYDEQDAGEFSAASARRVDPFAPVEEDEEENALTPAALPAPPPAAKGRGRTREQVVQNYSVHYQAGLPELNKSYNQAFNIVDPASGRSIGECGMMVNSINGILDNDPDAVIAMEVWLVDKKQELSFMSQDRILLSEYAYDRGLEAKITRDRPNDPSPIIPQSGRTSFEIKGPHLTLKCDVIEAVYAKSGAHKGVFESLRIDMTVVSRD